MFCRCQQSQSDYSDISPRNGDEDGEGERKKERRRRKELLVAAFRRFSREGESHDDDPRFSRLLIAFSPDIGIGQVIRRVVTLLFLFHSEKKRVTQTRKKRDSVRPVSEELFRSVYF